MGLNREARPTAADPRSRRRAATTAMMGLEGGNNLVPHVTYPAHRELPLPFLELADLEVSFHNLKTYYRTSTEHRLGCRVPLWYPP